MVGLLLATVVCCMQSDFKRLVAYSSVSHIITLVPIILFSSVSGELGAVYIMVFHGLSSPLLFMIVGLIYSTYSRRQFVFIRGLLVVSPFLSFLIVLAFFFSISTPPFPSFVGEVLFFMSRLYRTLYFMPVLFLFAFLSLVYSLL